eukprot:scaffold43516_cov21-Tisochrysis_lutea.AAC.1
MHKHMWVLQLCIPAARLLLPTVFPFPPSFKQTNRGVQNTSLPTETEHLQQACVHAPTFPVDAQLVCAKEPYSLLTQMPVQITEAPSVHSRGFHVEFDLRTHKDLGYILPTWKPLSPNTSSNDHGSDVVSTAASGATTRIVLPLRAGRHKRMTAVLMTVSCYYWSTIKLATSADRSLVGTANSIVYMIVPTNVLPNPCQTVSFNCAEREATSTAPRSPVARLKPE